MKAKVLIIATLTVSIILALVFTGHSQTKNTIFNSDDRFTKVTTYSANGVLKDSSILLADETIITYTKTEAKIETVNDSVFLDLLKSHQQLFKRYTCTWKHDKKETYKLYVIYLNKDDAAIIVKWAKTNL